VTKFGSSQKTSANTSIRLKDKVSLTPNPAQELIQQSAKLILAAQHTVVLTGAGISTPSGIPDFRSRDSGLWEQYDPMTVASLTSFRYNPVIFFEWVAPLVSKIINAKPNSAHIALAELEEQGFVHAIITQNIDSLHTLAGSKVVYEIHGHLRRGTCTSCFKQFDTEAPIRAFLETQTIPLCDQCGAILKPDIVLFGEQLPADIVRKSCRAIEVADLVIIAGSSLEVTPAATLPIQALNRGAQLIIINHEPTYLDERATVIFHEDVADVLPLIVKETFREQETSNP
jgi:NAD-dependent deacetylase